MQFGDFRVPHSFFGISSPNLRSGELSKKGGKAFFKPFFALFLQFKALFGSLLKSGKGVCQKSK
jgi:hypothetical protein